MITDYFPFTLDGESFLLAYAVAVSVCVAICMLIRIRIRASSDHSEKKIDSIATSLSPCQIGYLSNGPRGAIDVAIVSLCLEKKLKARNRKFTAKSQIPESDCDSDSLLFQAILSSASTETSLLKVRNSCKTAISMIHHQLCQRGLLMSFRRHNCTQVLILLVMSFPLLLGGIRVAQGLSTNHPVGYLIIFMLLTFISLLVLLVFSFKTRLGILVQKRLKRTTARPRKSAIKRAGFSKRTDREAFDSAVVWALAVFGVRQAEESLERGHSIKILRNDIYESKCSAGGMWVSVSGHGGGGDGGGGSSGCGGSGCGGGGCGGCGG